MKKRLPLLFIFSILISFHVFTQGSPTPPANADGVYFSYDNSGNQKSRDWACLSCATKSLPEKEKDSIIAEVSVDLNDKIKNSKLVAYPNPTTDYLNLEWNDSSNKKPQVLQLYSLDSKLLYQRKIIRRSGRLEIPVNKYPSGIYILVVSYNEGKNESFKIIKK